jgi:predicted Zn-dependent protease with MMP-like domain/thioredoxin-like negative regulator of GroEL
LNGENPALEDGWRRFEDGEFQQAKAIAERELDRDPEDPEAMLLLAASYRELGQPAQALDVLADAAGIAHDWSAPELWTAEILVQDLDRPIEALGHAARALDRAEEEDEFIDAIVLKAGLEIQLGKSKAARSTLAELPSADEVRLPAESALDLAYLFLEADAPAEAEQRLRAILDQDERNEEAWYGLGLCAEARGDEKAKREAWLHVLSLDTEAPLEGPHLSESEMAEVAEKALKELPDKARRLIENVPILIVDLPARDEVELGLDPRLLGLFAGTAYSDASLMGGSPELTQILLFRKNLERMSFDPDDLREQIRVTLLHETGHFFGMSEDDLAAVGLE